MRNDPVTKHNTRRFRIRGLPTPSNKFSSVGNPWRLFWKDKLGDQACPYITRWVMDLGPLGSIRLHHWLGNDDQRAHHDHPWGFLTLVLAGSYTDVTHHAFMPGDAGPNICLYCGKRERACGLPAWQHPVENLDVLHAGSMRWRPAEHAHTVRTTGAWTLLWTTPKQRFFGFFVRKAGRVKWIKANRFFHEWGHPPCSDA